MAIGFAKPARFYGHTITNKDELLQAAAAFKVCGESCALRSDAWP